MNNCITYIITLPVFSKYILLIIYWFWSRDSGANDANDAYVTLNNIG